MTRPLTTCAGERIRTTHRTVSGDAWKRHDLAPAEEGPIGALSILLFCIAGLIFANTLMDDVVKLLAAVLP